MSKINEAHELIRKLTTDLREVVRATVMTEISVRIEIDRLKSEVDNLKKVSDKLGQQITP